MSITTAGRIVRDAKINTVNTKNGPKEVVNFTVVNSRTYKNKQGERTEEPTYFDCAYWRSTNVAQYLTKGTVIEMSGEISAGVYYKKEDTQKKTPQACLKFRVGDFKFLARPHGPATDNDAGSAAAANKQPAHAGDDLPF